MMQHSIKNIFIFCLVPIILFSCRQVDNKSNKTATKITRSVFKNSLKEQPIGNTGYYISLPLSYSIRELKAADFLVYYFSVSDTTIKEKFSAGLYFGLHPDEPEADDKNCKKMEPLDGNMLGKIRNWKNYYCRDAYTLQTTIDNPSGEGWNDIMQAFGNGKNKEELASILEIFSTLRKAK